MLSQLEFMGGSTHRTYMDMNNSNKWVINFKKREKGSEVWALEDKVDWNELKGKVQIIWSNSIVQNSQKFLYKKKPH